MCEVSRAEFIEDLERVVGVAPFQRANEDAWTWTIDPSGLLRGGREVLIQERADVGQVGRYQNIICAEARAILQNTDKGVHRTLN